MTYEQFVEGFNDRKRRIVVTSEDGVERGRLVAIFLEDLDLDSGMIGFLSIEQACIDDPSDDLQRECSLDQIEWAA